MIAAGDLINALRHQVGQRVVNVGRMTLIIESVRHLMGKLNLPVYSTEDQRTEIRRERPTIKIGADC